MQFGQAGLELASDLFRRHPGQLALFEVARLAKDVVDVVGRARPDAGAGGVGLQAESVSVQNRGLPGLGLDAFGNDLGKGGRAVGGREQQLGELPDREWIEIAFELEQRPRLLDHEFGPGNRGQGLVRGGARGRVFGRDVGGSGPGGLIGYGLQRLDKAARDFEESTCLALLRGRFSAWTGVKTEGSHQRGSQCAECEKEGQAA